MYIRDEEWPIRVRDLRRGIAVREAGDRSRVGRAGASVRPGVSHWDRRARPMGALDRRDQRKGNGQRSSRCRKRYIRKNAVSPSPWAPHRRLKDEDERAARRRSV